MWAALSVAVPLLFFADDFVSLYLGDVYSEAALVIVFFMLIFPFTSPTALLGQTAMARAKVRGFNLMAFVFQLVGLALMLLILSFTNLGSTGMALSLCFITILSQLLYYWGLCLRLTNKTFAEFFKSVLLPGAKPALIASIVWLSADLIGAQDSWASLILSVMTGVVAYGVALLFAGLDRQEQADLLGVVRGRFGERAHDGQEGKRSAQAVQRDPGVS